MSIILEPLIESPDGYQVAYIKKVLNKIKVSNDGLIANANAAALAANPPLITKTAAAQNLFNYNKVNQ